MAPRTAARLSLANVTAEAIDVHSLHADGFAGLMESERMTVIIPPPTASDRRQYSIKSAEDWESEEGGYEYRESFEPMMNHLWPVEFAYGIDAKTAASAINERSIAISLVHLDTDTEDLHFLALTGGGMDLSDHIAKAYLACGCVPPLRILDRLGGSHQHWRAGEARLMRGAMRKAASHLRIIAARLGKSAASVQAPKREKVAS